MKAIPEAKEGDIVEIYHPALDEQNPRLLLQIKSFKEDRQASNVKRIHACCFITKFVIIQIR